MSRLSPSVLVPYAALLVITAAGCGPGTSPTPPRITAAETCQPRRAVLVVRNQSGYEADIMQHERRSGTTRLLTTVRHGRHEIDIPNDGAYSYSARQGGANVSDSPFPQADPVTLEIECRNG